MKPTLTSTNDSELKQPVETLFLKVMSSLSLLKAPAVTLKSRTTLFVKKNRFAGGTRRTTGSRRGSRSNGYISENLADNECDEVIRKPFDSLSPPRSAVEFPSLFKVGTNQEGPHPHASRSTILIATQISEALHEQMDFDIEQEDGRNRLPSSSDRITARGKKLDECFTNNSTTSGSAAPSRASSRPSSRLNSPVHSRARSKATKDCNRRCLGSSGTLTPVCVAGLSSGSASNSPKNILYIGKEESSRQCIAWAEDCMDHIGSKEGDAHTTISPSDPSSTLTPAPSPCSSKMVHRSVLSPVKIGRTDDRVRSAAGPNSASSADSGAKSQTVIFSSSSTVYFFPVLISTFLLYTCVDVVCKGLSVGQMFHVITSLVRHITQIA